MNALAIDTSNFQKWRWQLNSCHLDWHTWWVRHCSWHEWQEIRLTKLDKSIRPGNSLNLGAIHFLEFPLQLLQVLVRKFLRVRSLTKGKVAYTTLYDVAVRALVKESTLLRSTTKRWFSIANNIQITKNQPHYILPLAILHRSRSYKGYWKK